MWAVVVSLNGKRKFKEFNTKEEALSIIGVVEKAALERYPEALCGVVSLKEAFPIPINDSDIDGDIKNKRKNKKKNKGGKELWCPYCIDYKTFSLDRNLDILRCILCGMSESDFYVRMYNRTWND